MALSATTIAEVETGGSDTANGGLFDPGQTAGMFTDGAATVANTSAPVFTSASYNFVAGDANAWIYIASGSNWIPGWYQITLVAANAATLNGTIGQGVLATFFTPTTVVGCATTAGPSAATWTIDYSQQSGVKTSYTDLASAGTGLTVSSAAHPFGRQQVGNCIVITGVGTNFNLGRYVIASVAAITFIATVVGPTNITTGVGANGLGAVGGAFASPGAAGSVAVANNVMFIKAATYTISSATANIATGCVSWPASTGGSEGSIQGYQTTRGDFGTRPLLQASGISTFTIVSLAGAKVRVSNIAVDGATLTASKGIANATNASGTAYKCKASNCTAGGILTFAAVLCEATGCSAVAAIGSCVAFGCWSHDNTITGFSASAGAFGANTVFVSCISSNNTGGSSFGFQFSTTSANPDIADGCVSFASGSDGFRSTSGGSSQPMISNSISVNSGGWGFNLENVSGPGAVFLNCAGYNNTPSNVAYTSSGVYSLIALSGNPFNNSGSNDYSLNNTAGAGALLRAAGYPGVYPGGLTTGYLDIGAVQHQDTPNIFPVFD